MSIKQLERYIAALEKYRDGILTKYINKLKDQAQKAALEDDDSGSNPPGPPPPPPTPGKP